MKTVKSVERAILVLQCLARARELTIGEIRAALRMPKSTAHEIVWTLVARGMVDRNADGVRFRLGLKAFELGMKAQANLEVRTVATPVLKELSRVSDETVHLTVLDAGEVLYIESFESSKSLRTHSAVGYRAPLHCTGVGKAILAFLDRSESDAVIRRKGLARFTARTITSAAAMRQEIRRIRDRGFAVDNCEHEDGVRCVGAPIRDHTGRVIASLSVSAPAQRMPDERVQRLGADARAAASEISRLLGCPAGKEVRAAS